jgi:hypothetical protein
MYVVHAEGLNYRTRLEEVDGNRLSLATPLETSGQNPLPGNQLDVFWALPRTRVILPCKLIEIGESAPYRWVLEPVGVARQSNRREYVRGGGGGPVWLASGERDDAMVGRLLDISEGGLRCWVARAPQVGAGGRVMASVPLGKTEVEVDGSVIDVRDAWDEPGHHMILQFQAAERVARMIRQHVFAWEVAERRRFDAY